MKTQKPRAADGVDLKWLDGKAPSTTPSGTAFGVPWAQGEVDRTSPIAVLSGGSSVPVQTWPLAFWPDGTLKWSGHALQTDSGLSDSLTLSVGTPAEPQNPVSVQQSSEGVTVTTGPFTAKFNNGGTTLVSSLELQGKSHVQNGVLELLLQDGPDQGEVPGPRPTVSSFQGRVDSVTVEQKGPVRAVIKATGKYSGAGHDDFLPFVVRFYISAGATSLRMVHFFIYDGDQNKDFIKGIGLTFTTPLSDKPWDRHIRFVTTEGGIWGEPVVVLSGLRRDATAVVLDPQFEGEAVPDISEWPTSVSSEVDQLAVWSDYTLDQLSSSNFSISKRTNAGSKASFIPHAGFGKRAAGLGYVGGATGGGVVFGLKDFWEAFPRGLDIRGAHNDNATVTLWAYNPRGPVLDMRHYDTVPHGLDLSYEDVGDPDPDPTGIGRSYEVSIQVVPATPSRSTLAQLAAVHTQTPQIVASPQFYASHKLFGGRWDVPNASRATDIEKRKSNLLDFYVAEIDQRNFYGFWNYGDVMHTYDQTRHTWRYDIGGFAWDNGELGTDLWLWMSFLRTGRADVFRLASAMTRHLSETDFHHTGPYAGLGSRHNVSHWGDGAKEARVGAAALKRPFYYLTTDELMGDVMDFALQAGDTIMNWDPLRKALPRDHPNPNAPGRLRIGPDWVTLAGNWFTKWERTNDSQWLNKIKVGMKDIGSFQFGLFTGNGAAVGWNAATGHMFDEGESGSGSYHLTMLFGGGELLMEAMDIITDEPEFDAAWIDFCRLYNGTNAQKTERYGKAFNSGGFNNVGIRFRRNTTNVINFSPFHSSMPSYRLMLVNVSMITR
ncbi:hypothetical protein E1B28_002711 [Marasmius oreades]|uniref:Tat pathway signal sequence domain protein n=1 Tax=Marasmius oreades TaxID=181124 RepID=A0A9P7RNW8_9AGAR|nr:uncharacterized protein E1B28_002711 [Marasmius oreades]KAG7086782.1 hypothetical protein E1B28_002711 [Marasmius oreades]